MSMTDGLLHRAAERIWLLPPEEERDRPVLGYVHGDRWSLQIDAGASPAHLALFHRALAEQGLPAPALVVLTHWHWDHSFGLAGLTCPSLAGECTQRELERVSRWGWTEEEMARRLATGEEIPLRYPSPPGVPLSRRHCRPPGGSDLLGPAAAGPWRGGGGAPRAAGYPLRRCSGGAAARAELRLLGGYDLRRLLWPGRRL